MQSSIEGEEDYLRLLNHNSGRKDTLFLLIDKEFA